MFVRGEMLSPAEGIPEWRDGKICRRRTRSRQLACQKANVRTYVPAAQNLSSHCPIYHPKRRGYGGVPPCFPIVLDLCRCRVFPEKRVWGQSAPTLRKARGLPLPPAGVSGFCQNAPGRLGFCSLLLYTIIGKFESFFLFYIYGYSPRLQNSHTAFSLLRRACRTRMTEQQNLSALHAKLEAGLSEGKCSPLCRAMPHRMSE